MSLGYITLYNLSLFMSMDVCLFCNSVDCAVRLGFIRFNVDFKQLVVFVCICEFGFAVFCWLYLLDALVCFVV